MKKAIIFDMDGVIVDSEPLHVATERQVCEERNIPVPLSEWKNFQGQPDSAIFGRIVSGFTDGSVHPNQLIEHKRRLFMEKVREVKLVEGAGDFVRMARKRFRYMGLATSSGRAYMKTVLGETHGHGLKSFFDVIVTREDVRNGKPDPEPYLLAAERLGVSPTDCYAIEDSANGIRSAKSAGCDVIGIATSLPVDQLLLLRPHFVAKNFKEVAEFLYMY